MALGYEVDLLRLIRTTGSQRTEEELTTDAEILEAYQTHFGIALSEVPLVRSFG